MKLAVGLLCIATGVLARFVYDLAFDPRQPAPAADPSAIVEHAAPTFPATCVSAADARREPVPEQTQEIGGVSLTCEPSPLPELSAVEAAIARDMEALAAREGVHGQVPTDAERLDSERDINARLQRQLYDLRLELEECKNGPFSYLGNLRSLPEWPELDKSQRDEVLEFLHDWRIVLRPGEAWLIVTYENPASDDSDEVGLIKILGRARVWASANPEIKAGKDKWRDPYELYELFGDLVPRPVDYDD